jgi:hypothetical protein
MRITLLLFAIFPLSILGKDLTHLSSNSTSNIHASETNDSYVSGDIDNHNNKYLTGYINHSGYNSHKDVLIQKIGAENQIDWTYIIGDENQQGGVDIAVDHLSNIYVSGYFSGDVDFDPGPEEVIISSSVSKAFLLKLSNNGDFKWIKTFGNSVVTGMQIETDDSNNIVLCGAFKDSIDMDPDTSTFMLYSKGDFDVQVSKLDSSGNFIWAKSIGSYKREMMTDLKISKSNNSIICTGSFKDEEIDFNPGDSTHLITGLNKTSNSFLLCLSNDGDFKWVSHYGDIIGSCEIEALTIDKEDNLYIFSEYEGTVNFNKKGASFELTPQKYKDAVVVKVDSVGSFIWAKDFRSNAALTSWSITSDQECNVLVSGWFGTQTDFDPGSGTNYLSPDGTSSSYIVELSKDGDFNWVERIGCNTGYHHTTIQYMHVKSFNKVFIAGEFYDSIDTDLSVNENMLYSYGLTDAFFAEYEKKETVTGFSDLKSYASNNIYPQPCSNSFTYINNDKAEGKGRLYRMDGTFIRTMEINRGNNLIDISTLNSGLYIFLIGNKSNIVIKE